LLWTMRVSPIVISYKNSEAGPEIMLKVSSSGAF
jgi:hypothetical protein